ncbi:G2/mitotic-specific cyclin-B2-like [Ornithodoros turicata]|uniref:G2/mitotic-specific cyclin-B2-like n=1 Tax=Ornithodoros turicata TaxID=34597 RepID=UPI0031394FB1
MATNLGRPVLCSENARPATLGKPQSQIPRVGIKPLAAKNVVGVRRANSLKQTTDKVVCKNANSSAVSSQLQGKKLKQSTTILPPLARLSVKEESEPISYSSLLLPHDVNDVDEHDQGNPQLCAQYAKEIFNYLSQLELEYTIRANFLAGKREVTKEMRAILVNWLVQVHARFRLLQETLYLTVAVLDRYLQENEVSRSKLQLVGTTALFIACKYEEMYVPAVDDFVHISDDAFSKSDLLKMETVMLKALNFSLGRPLPLHFLRRASKAGMVDFSVHSMAKYFMELTIMEYDMAHVRPSLVAAAALWLSLQLLKAGNWTKDLAYYSKYTEKQMAPVAKRMCRMILAAGTTAHKAIYNKYRSPQFDSVSTHPQLQPSKIKEIAAQYGRP